MLQLPCRHITDICNNLAEFLQTPYITRPDIVQQSNTELAAPYRRPTDTLQKDNDREIAELWQQSCINPTDILRTYYRDVSQFLQILNRSFTGTFQNPPTETLEKLCGHPTHTLQNACRILTASVHKAHQKPKDILQKSNRNFQKPYRNLAEVLQKPRRHRKDTRQKPDRDLA